LTPIAASVSSLPRYSTTYAGWELAGTRGRTVADHTDPTPRASDATSISKLGAYFATAISFIRAPALAKTWHRRRARPTILMTKPIYPGKCRARTDARNFNHPAGINWRFRVPDGEEVTFNDVHFGPQKFIAGCDFGDFVIWRKDDVPAYQLAVVVDDIAMKISEVVRGADLLKSTARQLLLYRALASAPPTFYHCDLVRDEAAARLAKRYDSLSIHHLRESGWSAGQVRTRVLHLDVSL
jgi:glutamyl/glutaminyl-tRNA synthetase